MNHKPHPNKQEINRVQIQNDKITFQLKENNSQDEGSSQNNSQSQYSDDQIQQRVAFQIMEEEKLLQIRNIKNNNIKAQSNPQFQNHQIFNNQDELDDDQRQAFLYLHSVRKQKKSLLKQKKISKASHIQQQTLQMSKIIANPYKDKQIKNSTSISFPSLPQNSLKNSYKDCVLSNFNIVIQNIRYMIKSTQQYSHNNKKFNTKLYQSIKIENEPKIYDLMKLTIGQIQQLIRKLSLEFSLGSKQKKTILQQKAEIGQNKQKEGKENDVMITKDKRFKQYSLWIYSMLALHQGWASYKHFESLAQINFIIIKMSEYVGKLTDDFSKSLLLLLIIMVNVFEQRHLTKHLDLLIDRVESK